MYVSVCEFEGGGERDYSDENSGIENTAMFNGSYILSNVFQCTVPDLVELSLSILSLGGDL
jgi:hypothetical protein